MLKFLFLGFNFLVCSWLNFLFFFQYFFFLHVYSCILFLETRQHIFHESKSAFIQFPLGALVVLLVALFIKCCNLARHFYSILNNFSRGKTHKGNKIIAVRFLRVVSKCFHKFIHLIWGLSACTWLRWLNNVAIDVPFYFISTAFSQLPMQPIGKFDRAAPSACLQCITKIV